MPALIMRHLIGWTSCCCCSVTDTDLSQWTIQLGLTRRNSHSFFGPNYKVKRVVQHPLYNQAHDNDVALFQVTTEAFTP